MTREPTNQLYYGDNLEILRRYVPDASVDLIYLDPPFNSNADYNVLFAEKSGDKADAQIKAFGDTWQWGQEAAAEYAEVIRSGDDRLSKALRGMHDVLGGSNMLAYLSMMAIRLLELRRVLKPTGSLYLHCDSTASHYLKILLDAAFGAVNFRNEIIWKRTHAHSSSKRYGPVHDVILFYAKTRDYLWNRIRSPHDPEYLEHHFPLVDSDGRRFQPITLTGSGKRRGDSGKPWRGINPTDSGRHWAIPGAIIISLELTGGTVQEKLDALDSAGRIFWPAKQGGKPRLKWYVDELEGQAIADVWTDIPPISAHALERLGYPTQKPVALLERIIAASSNPTDTVLDPFCGCGTTIAAAQKLDRRWIGIDITHLAITLIKSRLKDSFGPKITEQYASSGEPVDFSSATQLAEEDKFQFQVWALGLIGARPLELKKGADKGIDGRLYFNDSADETETKETLISVKGGHVTASQVRDLRGVIEREEAALGVFLTLQPPTAAMIAEAAEAGVYISPSQTTHPRLQILTIEDVLGGKQVDMPPWREIRTFKRAPKTSRLSDTKSRRLNFGD